jgi:hypothetical protein
VSFGTIASYGWAARLGGSSYDYFNGVACDSSGNIYAVGYERSSTSGSNNETFITKWPSDTNNLPNGALVGTGLTLLSVNTPTRTVSTITLTASTTNLTVSAATLTVATTTLTVSTDTLTRYFSAF